MLDGPIQDIIVFVIALIVIAAVIYGIYYGIKKTAKKIRNKRAVSRFMEYQQTAGNFDEPAQRALNRIAETPPEERTAHENAQAALILYNNVLAGEHEETALTQQQRQNALNDTNNLFIRFLGDFDFDDVGQNPVEQILPMEFVMNNIVQFQHAHPNDNLRAAINTALPLRAEQKKKIAQSTAETRADEVQTYLDLNLTHTSDPQNVHDPIVADKFSNIVNVLKRDHPAYKQINPRAVMSILKNPVAARNAERIFSHPRTVGNLGITDADAILLTFARSQDDLNHKNKTLIHEAMNDRLALCTDGICSTGVSEQVLDSLNTLDFDPKLFNVRTTEDIKNELNERAKTIIQDTAIEFQNHPDSKVRNVAKYYDSNTTADEMKNLDEPDEHAEGELKMVMGERLTLMVHENKELRDYQKENVLKDILAAIN